MPPGCQPGGRLIWSGNALAVAGTAVRPPRSASPRNGPSMRRIGRTPPVCDGARARSGSPVGGAPPVVFESAPPSVRRHVPAGVAGAYRFASNCHIAAAADRETEACQRAMWTYGAGAMRDSFIPLAARVTNAAGSPYALVIAGAVIVTWL